MDPLTRGVFSNSIAPVTSREEPFFCGISVKEEEHIYKFRFSRAQYLSNMGLPKTVRMTKDSQPVQDLTKLFQHYQLLPEMWTWAQAKRAMASQSPTKRKLAHHFSKISCSAYRSYALEVPLSELSNAFMHKGFLISMPGDGESSLFARLYCNRFCNSIDQKISSLKSIYQTNKTESLAEYAQSLLNSDLCIQTGEMSSSLWREILELEAKKLRDESAFERLELTHAILKKKSYDVVIFQEDFFSSAIGIYLWAKSHTDIQIKMLLLGKDEQIHSWADFLFYGQYKRSNLFLIKIKGDIKSTETWSNAAHNSQSPAHIVLNYEQSYMKKSNQEISHPVASNMTDSIALYLKCKNVASAFFLKGSTKTKEICSPEMLNIWKPLECKAIIVEPRSKTSYCKRAFLLTSNVEVTNQQILSLFIPYPGSPLTLSDDHQTQNRAGLCTNRADGATAGEGGELTGVATTAGDTAKRSLINDEVSSTKRSKGNESVRATNSAVRAAQTLSLNDVVIVIKNTQIETSKVTSHESSQRPIPQS